MSGVTECRGGWRITAHGRAIASAALGCRSLSDVRCDLARYCYRSEAALAGVHSLSSPATGCAFDGVDSSARLYRLRYRRIARSHAGLTRLLFDFRRHVVPFRPPGWRPFALARNLGWCGRPCMCSHGSRRPGEGCRRPCQSTQHRKLAGRTGCQLTWPHNPNSLVSRLSATRVWTPTVRGRR
jgi:hypothetical protein